MSNGGDSAYVDLCHGSHEEYRNQSAGTTAPKFDFKALFAQLDIMLPGIKSSTTSVKSRGNAGSPFSAGEMYLPVECGMICTLGVFERVLDLIQPAPVKSNRPEKLG